MASQLNETFFDTLPHFELRYICRKTDRQTHTHTHMHTHIHPYTHIQTHTCTHAYIHPYTHIHINDSVIKIIETYHWGRYSDKDDPRQHADADRHIFLCENPLDLPRKITLTGALQLRIRYV